MSTMLEQPTTAAFPLAWSTPRIADVDALIAHVDAEVAAMLDHPTSHRLRRGDVPQQAVLRILANIAFQSFHGPTTFALAGARLCASHPTIGNYLIHHATEEAGHWKWAIDDIELLAGPSALADLQPSPEALAYVGWNYFLAQSTPLPRLGSAMFLERMSPRAADIAGALAVAVPADQRSRAFRYIRNHTVTDVQHSEEITALLREAALGAAELGLLAWAVSVSRPLYQGLFSAPLAEAGR